MSNGNLMADHPWAATFMLGLGMFCFARFAIKTVYVALQIFLLPGKKLSSYGSKQGAWAVVTGASDGIGREFAVQLAHAGFNVMLVARNTSKLEEVAFAIKTASPNVQTKVVAVDFSKTEASTLDSLTNACTNLDIGVLVNNVGKSHVMPVDFAETTQQEMNDILTVNVNGTLKVTHLVLPGMIQRKRGLILNLGSFSGVIASPMLATYSGTKAFLQTFSDALAAELKPKSITVQCLNTYFVVSSMSKIRRSSAFIPTPAAYVRACLSRVGLSGGAAFTGRPATATLYPAHALLDYVLGVLSWKTAAIRYTHNLHKDIRRRALRKAEREAKQQ